MCVLVLGDNIFYGDLTFFYEGVQKNTGATIFGYQVNDPERYGIVEFDKNGKCYLNRRKTSKSKITICSSRTYIFIIMKLLIFQKILKPSARGELEITDVNKEYLK